MLKKAYFASAAALFVVAVCLTRDVVSAQKPSPYLPVQIVFDDTSGNLITSDRAGPYVDNQPQLEATIRRSSGDLILNLNYTKKPERFLTFNLSPSLSPPCPFEQAPAYPIPEYFQAKAWMNVNDILSVTSGSASRGAQFETWTPVGTLRLGSRYNAHLNFCSTQVRVTRTGERTWSIESDPSLPTVACLIQDFNPAGGQTDYRAVRYCDQPFGLTVTLIEP